MSRHLAEIGKPNAYRARQRRIGHLFAAVVGAALMLIVVLLFHASRKLGEIERHLRR